MKKTEPFWNNKSAAVKKRVASAIVAKLIAEGAENMSDKELRRCLGNCVSGSKLMAFAQSMRENVI